MLEKFDERERLFILGGVLVVLLLIGFLVFTKVKKIRTDLSERVSETRTQYLELDKLIKDYHYYKSLKSGQAQTSQQIISKMEELLRRHALMEQLFSMRDSKTVILKRYNKITVDINLRSVKLNNVFKLLYDIEVNKQVNSKVEYFTFRKPLAGKEIYDVNIKLSSYSMIGK